MLGHYPIKDVTTWLGNSPAVANEHYSMATEENFTRAAEFGVTVRPQSSNLTLETLGDAIQRAASNQVASEKTPQNPPPTSVDRSEFPQTSKNAEGRKRGCPIDC